MYMHASACVCVQSVYEYARSYVSYSHTLIHSYTHILIYDSYTHTLIALNTYTHTLIHSYTHTRIHSEDSLTIKAKGVEKLKADLRAMVDNKATKTSTHNVCTYVCMYVYAHV